MKLPVVHQKPMIEYLSRALSLVPLKTFKNKQERDELCKRLVTKIEELRMKQIEL